MAENKKYITQTQEFGAVMISDDVVAAIVVNALKDVDGVVGITPKLGTDLAALKNWNKGLKISISDNNEIKVETSIVVTYGCAVIEVARNVQNAVCAAICNMTGIKPASVDVNVSGIARQ